MAIRPPVVEGGGPRPPDGPYERVPPHNIEAEESVLGSMLLSKDAIAEVLEMLREEDFYRPAHRTVFQSVLSLYAHGQAVDAVTVAELLRRDGVLQDIGGAPFLFTLVSGVPTAANAAYYARIVKEAGVLRRLIDVGTRIVQLGFETPQDTERAVDIAETLVYQVAQGRVSEDYQSLREVLTGTLEAIERLHEDRREITGVPTGFPDLDRLTSGLQNSNLIIVAARPAVGKCITGEMMLVESSSGARMTVREFVRRGQAGEDVRVHTLGDDWRLHTVRPSAFVDNGVRPVLRLTTRSGRTLRATGNHPLRTLDGWVPLEQLRPRDRIAAPRRLECGSCVEIPDALVALTAYLIGDGSLKGSTPRLTAMSPVIRADVRVWAERLGIRAVETAVRRCTTGDCGDDVRQQRADEDFHRHVTALDLSTARGLPNPLTTHLADMAPRGLGSADKHVPDAYFRMPERQIRLFLSRLYATDGWASVADHTRRSTSLKASAKAEVGYCSIKAEVGYCSISERLARDVQHLLLRLGMSAILRRRKVTYKGETRWAWQVTMHHAAQVERFCREVGIFSKERQVQTVLDAIEATRQIVASGSAARAGLANGDTVPRAVWELVRQEKGELSWAEVSSRCGRPRNHNWHADKEDLGRERLALLAKALDSEPLGQLADSDVLWDEVVSVEPDGVDQVYDLTIEGTHNFVVGDLVVHNSTLGLDVARHAAVRAQVPTVVFSLEMSKTELVQRLMCAECTVDMQRLRTGRMEESDWTRLTRSLGKLADAPLFIDDSATVTMMEIRAKCRRLKQRHGLGLVVVDYLQLMQPTKRVENRQQEVSEISRSLKLLAKELEVPVIAVSQLSRQTEARSDRRPMLSDLRESGCLTADTRVLRADTGAAVSLGELFARDARNVPVWTLDHDLELTSGVMTHVFYSGVKPVFELRLASGRTVRASANHPFLTLDGWRPLEALGVGARLATPRSLAEPSTCTPWPDHEVVLLARLLGDGRRSPVASWLDVLGLSGCHSHEKFVPGEVSSLPRAQVALFLRHLWATGGRLRVDRVGVRLWYSSTSRRLVGDLQLLLLRFGIASRVEQVEQAGHRPGYRLYIHGPADQLQFLEAVGVHGTRGHLAEAAVELLRSVGGSTNLDTVPVETCERVRARIPEGGTPTRPFQTGTAPAACGSTPYRVAPSRARVGTAALLLDGPQDGPQVDGPQDGPQLVRPATSGISWDAVTGLEPLGEQPVFDATVPGTHNFIANGVVAHNSLEQDADVVLFIYREELYDPESPRKGEADFILAKHRNGPTDTVTVTFQGQYSRFAPMAARSL
jgi:replicative DNA helicase